MRSRVLILITAVAALAAILPASAQQALIRDEPVDAYVDRMVGQWVDSVDQSRSVNLLRGAVRLAPAEPSRFLAAAPAVGGYSCLPTCSETDGRMFSLAGSGLATVVGGQRLFRIAAANGTASFEIGFFDGETGGTWDLPRIAPPEGDLTFELFTDPDADGVGDTLVWSGMGSSMTDNGWYDVTVNPDASAQVPSGNYFYVLRIAGEDLDQPAATGVWSNFKVRSTGIVSLLPQSVSYTAPLFGPEEGYILYPNAGSGDLTTTTYDGNWQFYLDVDEGFSEFEMWDGDFDRGSVGDIDLDTDDPNSSGIPAFAAGGQAVAEGVASGSPCDTVSSATGCPADNREAGVFLRSPAIRYELVTSDGQVFPNDNPSGNREWERFRIVTQADGDEDVVAAGLPSGVGRYLLDTFGVDLSNLNALRFPVPLLCVTENGEPCEPLRPYLIGDTVWLDSNGNGVQDNGEPGIPGVTLTHINDFGFPVATATTDSNGNYFIPVEAGLHEVLVDASNFSAGGALEGLVSTTGGETQTRPVVDTNNLDFDFGYIPPVSECLPSIDFDTDDAGGLLAKGTVIAEQWAALGVHFSTNNPGSRPLMIFDSSAPTGGDPDLGTPNQDFGGPGVGNGGRAGQPGANYLSLGNLLIISEDGDSGDPDDNAGGGVITATFDLPVRVDAIHLVDLDASETATITAFDAGGTMVAQASSQPLGNNSFQVVELNATGVSELTIQLSGSGAVAKIVFCAENEPPLPPAPRPNQGCTPGYWKQNHHLDSWVGYQPTADYATTMSIAQYDPNNANITKSLLQALWQGGGQHKALGRHATAALLNAANPNVNYLYTEAEILTMVQSAYTSGNFNHYKNLLRNQNECGCPLN